MKKILMISKYYIPDTETISHVLYRYTKLFRDNGYQVDCICSKTSAEKIPEYLLDRNKINIKRIYRKTGGWNKIKNKRINKLYQSFFKRTFGNRIFFDIYYLYKLLTNKYDIILTQTNPEGFHWYGIFAKKLFKNKILWIASFSDPYANSPFGESPKLLKEENLTFELSDKIIYISESQKNYSFNNKRVKNYNMKKEKAKIVPMFYLEAWKKIIRKELINKINDSYVKNSKKLKIIHGGNLYGKRNPKELFEVLKEFEKEIQFINYGKVERKYRNNLSSNILLKDAISFDNILEESYKADYIVIIDSFFDEVENPYLPSKIVDAMYLDKPILGITEEGTELYKFLKETNNITCLNTKNEIRMALKKLLNNNETQKIDYSNFSEEKVDIIKILEL